MASDNNSNKLKRIEVSGDGPYLVFGDIPLVSKIQVVSEFSEPLAWKKGDEIPAEGEYCLCRCGHSSCMPFCDGTHNEIEFDGTEQAPINSSSERRMAYEEGTKMIIHFDMELCSEAGFCANARTSIAEMAAQVHDIQVRTQAIGMIEHCPSGALTYQIEGNEENNEVDLPQQIAWTTEMTSNGPIRGPLWVTGSIPIIRSDGKPFEARNRVTLCNCGQSRSKPLCDGSHRSHPIPK